MTIEEVSQKLFKIGEIAYHTKVNHLILIKYKDKLVPRGMEHWIDPDGNEQDSEVYLLSDFKEVLPDDYLERTKKWYDEQEAHIRYRQEHAAQILEEKLRFDEQEAAIARGELMSIPQLVDYYEKSESTIYRYIRKNDICEVTMRRNIAGHPTPYYKVEDFVELSPKDEVATLKKKIAELEAKLR